MKKLTALLLGLLMLGGIAGVVSAATAPYLKASGTGTYGKHTGINYDITNGAFKISWEAYMPSTQYDLNVTIINVTTSANGWAAIWVVYDASTSALTLYYGTSSSGISSQSLEPANFFDNWHNFTIEVSPVKVISTTYSEATFYLDNTQVGSESYVIDTNTIISTTGFKLNQCPNDWPLYLDNVLEYHGDTLYTSDDFSNGISYFDDTSGSVTTSSSVPFFSDATTAGAIAILLAVGAIWFFRRH
jgi:hypothetical protein